MKLTQARYAAFARLGSEINERIERACKLYNLLLKEADVALKDETIWHNGNTYLDVLNRGLDLNWSTSWAYGGHNSGDNFIPWKCLVDDIWEEETTKRAIETITKYKANERAEKRGERAEERRQFEKLKRQFEPEK